MDEKDAEDRSVSKKFEAKKPKKEDLDTSFVSEEFDYYKWSSSLHSKINSRPGRGVVFGYSLLDELESKDPKLAKEKLQKAVDEFVGERENEWMKWADDVKEELKRLDELDNIVEELSAVLLSLQLTQRSCKKFVETFKRKEDDDDGGGYTMTFSKIKQVK
jgi:hypothetical protein